MTIKTIPLNQLTNSTGNPRTQFDTESIAGLAASIAKDGLLQNLVVAKVKQGYRILAGERRYRALSHLVEQGTIQPDFPVPVKIKSNLSKQETLRLATVENVQREAMNPMDEAEAFAKLCRKGTTPADIAAETGLAVSTVQRRLALANLCDTVKQAAREGEIGLGMAEALTLGTDEQQRECLDHMARSHYAWDATDIRHSLLDSRPTKAMAIFDLNRYTGSFTTDLFGEEESTYFDDCNQFRELQQQAIEELIAECREKETWVDVFEQAYSWPRWSYEKAEEGEATGVVIHVKPDLTVDIITGLKPRSETVAELADKNDSPTEPEPRPEFTGKAISYMAVQKSRAVQAALLVRPRTAKEIAVTQMLCRYGDVTLSLHASLNKNEGNTGSALEMITTEASHLKQLLAIDTVTLDTDKPDNPLYWLLHVRKEPFSTYEAVKRLEEDDLDALHLFLTILTFGQRDFTEIDNRGETFFSAVAIDLGVEMRDWWQPDTEFLSLLRKDTLLDYVQECGIPLTKAIRKATKGALVDTITRHIESCKQAKHDKTQPFGIGQKLMEQANAWCPVPMRFDPLPSAQDAETH